MERPVFVVGHPRSGTTLLQLLLGSGHLGIAPETHFFTYVMEPYASQIAIEYLGHRRRGPTCADRPTEILKRLATKPGIHFSPDETELVREAASNPGSAAVVLNVIMEILVSRSGEYSRWLEKTPRHFFFVKEILELFPDAYLLFMMRDPRDVVSSPTRFRNLGPGSERNEFCRSRTESWVRSATAFQSVVEDRRCLLVKYEDLIDNPNLTLETTSDFADLRISPRRP